MDQRTDIEYQLLLEATYQVYGYDFRSYSEASLKRRLRSIMAKAGLQSLSQLQHKFLHEPDFFAGTLSDFTVSVSEMFRDPSFFRALREKVLPILSTYPAFKIWCAGCSSGEEVYSLAILLREAGLGARAVIYASDVSPKALKAARSGIFPLENLKLFSRNYQLAGGTASLSDYYTALYGAVRFDPQLRENIVFSDHNLVTDSAFAECELILCRNVLIYFRKDLQNRVIELFSKSLSRRGFLGLGSKETVRFLETSNCFEDFDREEKIFRLTAAASPAYQPYPAMEKKS